MRISTPFAGRGVCLQPTCRGGAGAEPYSGGLGIHGRGGAIQGHEATDTGLAYAPVSQAHGHNHIVQCCSSLHCSADQYIQGGGGGLRGCCSPGSWPCRSTSRPRRSTKPLCWPPVSVSPGSRAAGRGTLSSAQWTHSATAECPAALAGVQTAVWSRLPGAYTASTAAAIPAPCLGADHPLHHRHLLSCSL